MEYIKLANQVQMPVWDLAFFRCRTQRDYQPFYGRNRKIFERL